ncbi:MAG: rhomboid family intramembrane serine protease [Spirochaetia bacterium]
MSKLNINRPFPYRFYNATFYLIAANLIVFMITMISQQALNYLAMNPVLVIRHGFVWQIVTYMFSHAGISHILFNMLGLFFFGLQVERTIGSDEFLFFYFFSGIGAGLISLLVYWLTGSFQVFLLGASGAVFAVLLAFATFYPTARIFIMGIFPIRAPILVILYTIIELLSQFSATSSNVAHLTHLAGFGIAFVYLIWRQGKNPVQVFLDSYR